mmetsp:Transcript_31125/g.67129  ORF Transcript_31125/g.67129 Transcript_31125/m.67129 type:complete len:296 (+) Transcript_31125:941-1828(+)
MTTRKGQDYHVKGLLRMDLCGSLRAQDVSGSSIGYLMEFTRTPQGVASCGYRTVLRGSKFVFQMQLLWICQKHLWGMASFGIDGPISKDPFGNKFLRKCAMVVLEKFHGYQLVLGCSGSTRYTDGPRRNCQKRCRILRVHAILGLVLVCGGFSKRDTAKSGNSSSSLDGSQRRSTRNLLCRLEEASCGALSHKTTAGHRFASQAGQMVSQNPQAWMLALGLCGFSRVAPGIKFLFLGDCAVYVQISLRSTSCLQVEASCGNAHGSMACWLGTKCIGTIGIEMVQLGRRTKKLATV